MPVDERGDLYSLRAAPPGESGADDVYSVEGANRMAAAIWAQRRVALEAVLAFAYGQGWEASVIEALEDATCHATRMCAMTWVPPRERR